MISACPHVQPDSFEQSRFKCISSQGLTNNACRNLPMTRPELSAFLRLHSILGASLCHPHVQLENVANCWQSQASQGSQAKPLAGKGKLAEPFAGNARLANLGSSYPSYTWIASPTIRPLLANCLANCSPTTAPPREDIMISACPHAKPKLCEPTRFKRMFIIRPGKQRGAQSVPAAPQIKRIPRAW